MPSRLNYILKKRIDNKSYYLNLKYPEIPFSANEFLNDVDLWWIITTANPDIIRRDSFNLQPGIEIRIPSNIQGIIEAFETLNK